LTVISQYLGFFPWYHGLALGGIAKVGQTQLLQPFLTIIASVLLLGEHADLMTWLVATLVVAVVAVGKHAQVKHNDPESATIADTSPHS
ncbi:EamA family transporter, partial [Nitrosomonas europaea]